MAPGCMLTEKKIDFQECLKKGKKIESDFLRLVFLKKEGVLKFFFIIPKKIVSKAVKRNKIKRWLREAVRKNQGLVDLSGYFFFFLKKDTDLNFQKVNLEVEKILKNV